MKRLLFVALAACAIALLAMVGVAGADGGPHGGYTPTTDGCAGCHRAHTAAEPSLLTTPVADLCYSCHGTTATGADTNVEDGVYVDTAVRDGVPESPPEGVAGRGLKGGGFANALMDTDFDNVAASLATTSAHNHDDVTTGTAWGNGDIGSGAGLTGFALGCTDCHDPHGNGNYRILRGIPSDSGAAAVVNVLDEGTKTYTVSEADSQYFGEGRANAFGNTIQYEELTGWCAQCHTRYAAGIDSGRTDSGDAIFAYRHMAGAASNSGTIGLGACATCHGTVFNTTPIVTFNDAYWNHQVDCMTCHVAHGTSADMTTDGPYSGSVVWPDGSTTPNGDARSSLLRADGRGVCQGCHNQPGTATPPPD